MVRLLAHDRRRARWRELTVDEEATAVAALRELASGRADLLAEVAGILEGTSEGRLDEPLARCVARLCRLAGTDPDTVPAWIEEGGGSGRAYAAAFGRPAARDWPGTGVPVPEMAEDLVEQVARVRAEYAALPGPGELRAMEAAILVRPDMPSASAARLRTLIAAAVDLAEQADEFVERLDELPAADRT